MDKILRSILITLLNSRIIGAKHTPESPLLNPKLKYLNKRERDDFEVAFRDCIRLGLILRIKKRTGKGSDWHISLSSEHLIEIKEMLLGGEER